MQTTAPHIAIRPATEADSSTILRLAALDSAPAPHGAVLVADARSGSMRFLKLGDPATPPITYAAASDVLFVARIRRTSGHDSYHDVDVIQVSTGALLKTLDISLAKGGARLRNDDCHARIGGHHAVPVL